MGSRSRWWSQARKSTSPAGDSATEISSSPATPLGGKGEVVEERERLPQEGRQVGRAEPGCEVIEETVQGLLVGRSGRAVEGALEERTDKLEHERVVGCVHVCHRWSPFASDGVRHRL